LAKLERNAVFDGGCPACRHRRGQLVTVFSEEQDDGTITEPEGPPSVCARCGEVPEQVVRVVEVVVDSPADSALA
jgi:hypothetical protein